MAESEEEARAMKQTYLREAILEAGYDGEKFQAYLEKAKGRIES